LDYWNHVIQSELRALKLSATVLASVLISSEYVGTRESNDLFSSGERHVAQETQHGRNLHAKANRSNFEIALFHHFDFPLK
jgi:hypothetical protein